MPRTVDEILAQADELAARLTDVLTADPEEYLRMQQASLDGVAVHDIERTLDTFEALYRGRPVSDPVVDTGVIGVVVRDVDPAG